VFQCNQAKKHPDWLALSSSSSSGAEPPLVGSFGLLNDDLPLCSTLDTGYPIFDLHLTEVLYDVVLPSMLGLPLGLVVKGFHLNIFLAAPVSGILCIHGRTGLVSGL